jgi:peroxiredoxin Q/BCP
MASTDKPADNKAFAELHSTTFPILSDPEKSACQAFGVMSEYGFARRWTFYIDKAGIIQKIDKAVDPRIAGEQLVENLKQLNLGGG